MVIGVFAVILFFPLVNTPLPFVAITIFASLAPDIDTAFSKVGRNVPAKVIQVFTEHRGMLHSLTLCTILSLIIAFFIPVLAFGFFLGYGLHLLTDSFTKQGIAVFWPYSKLAKGVLPVGGIVEKGIFFTFTLVDIMLILINIL